MLRTEAVDNPCGYQVEHLRVEAHQAAVGIPGAADQAGLLEYLDVLADRLHVGLAPLGELADRGVAVAQPLDQVTPGRIRKSLEDLKHDPDLPLQPRYIS
jgi:hypothetical protein